MYSTYITSISLSSSWKVVTNIIMFFFMGTIVFLGFIMHITPHGMPFNTNQLSENVKLKFYIVVLFYTILVPSTRCPFCSLEIRIKVAQYWKLQQIC